LGRHVIIQKTGEERVEVVYGGTSLRPERAHLDACWTWYGGIGTLRTSRIGCAM
jgi:hypothetical protein